MDSNDQRIGRLIVWGRNHMGISVEDLAVELGVSVSDVLKMEHGEARPEPKHLLVMSEVFHVQPTWFFPSVPHLKKMKIPPRAHLDQQERSPNARSGLELMIYDLRVSIAKGFDEVTLMRLIGALRDVEQAD